MSGSAPSPVTTQPPARLIARRLPIGVEPAGSYYAHVRVWAPRAARLEFVHESGRATPLQRETDGYFSARVDAAAGDRYRFRIDDDDRLYPDPASRFQPEGPHGPSEIVEPGAFQWTDERWSGVSLEGQVLYELHVGTFTRSGTWAAAASELAELARLGITTIEVMPIAEFEGRFGWGYDGVDLFAPSHLYGRPDDFRRFVDAAHGVGLGVILDTVYNHFGPVGNYLRAFSPSYFTERYDNEWGDAVNYDGPDAGPVREFFIANAGYWIDEFHLDGLRLDATQQIFDASSEHILAAIGRRAREAAGRRSVVLVAEHERQETQLIRPVSEGGYGLDAVWNDDFHHGAMVALTGRSDAYYMDTRGTPQEFVSAAKYGYLFQGQHYHWQEQPRGTPAWGLAPARFVTFLQNHDQIANSLQGARGHELASPARWRAMTALLLLGPGTPMLFQGQEFSASAPFLYFADLPGELADAVRKGRQAFVSQFASVADALRTGSLDDPGHAATFERCRLDLRERESHAKVYAMHADLLRLRREEAAFRNRICGSVDGAVLTPSAFALRFFTPDHRDEIVNLGADIRAMSFAEPLLAPPADADWVVQWSSEDPSWGGSGTPAVLPKDDHWLLPGECAILLSPGPRRTRRVWPKVRRQHEQV